MHQLPLPDIETDMRDGADQLRKAIGALSVKDRAAGRWLSEEQHEVSRAKHRIRPFDQIFINFEPLANINRHQNRSLSGLGLLAVTEGLKLIAKRGNNQNS